MIPVKLLIAAALCGGVVSLIMGIAIGDMGIFLGSFLWFGMGGICLV